MKKFLWAGLLLALASSVALAQIITGSIFGTVRTPDGPVISGVAVTLSSGHTATLTTTTSDRGVFRFGELSIGEYTLTFELEGYQHVVRDGVVVRLGTATRLEVMMEASDVEALITITGETAVVDVKNTGTSTALTQDVLANIPSARDPWVIMEQVPGVTVDRVNVGGSESGQQSAFVSHGDDGDDAMWIIDGVVATDAAATGATPNYWDFDSFEEMQITTSGADATIQTAGLALNFITKQGSDTFHGQTSFYYTEDGFQSENVPADMEALGYEGNTIRSIKDYGFDVGGPILPGRLWFWGAYRVQDIDMLTAGVPDATELTNYNIKFTGQLGDRNRFTFFYTRGEKIKSGRGAAWNRPPETTHDQGGPTNIYKFEDTFIVSDSLILTGKVAYIDGFFFLEPKGGRTVPITRDYGTGMWGGSMWYYETWRPSYNFNLDAEQYIEEAFGGSHEIRAGFEYRHTPVTSISGASGNIYQCYVFGVPYSTWLIGGVDTRYIHKRASFFLMDIFSRDRWTFNFGVRYDRQWGWNKASVAGGNDVRPDLIPALDYQGQSGPVFTWNDIVPRLGMTYDLFGDGKTIIRANFSMYAETLTVGDYDNVNPLGWRELDYGWTDLNNDDAVQTNELGSLYWWWNVDPSGASDPLDNGYRYDPGLTAKRTTELIVGLEREVMPDTSFTGNFIYRRFTNYFWSPEDNWSSADYFQAGTYAQGGYTMTYYDSNEAHTYTYLTQNRPDYYRRYWAIELGVVKRLSNRWMANLSFNYNRTTQHYASASAYIDPTGIDMLDGYDYAPETSGSGKSAIWVGSNWMLKATALYQFPFGVNVSGFLNVRQGYAFPIQARTERRPGVGDRAYQLAVPFGSERLPTLMLVDLRFEKVWDIGDVGRLGIMIDAFNLFNVGTVLGRNRNLYEGTYDRVTEIINPRVFRFGMRFLF